MLNGLLERFASQELVMGRRDEERKRIKNSIENLSFWLKHKLEGEIEEIFPFGSWTRNTILPRAYDENSDIDLMVVFKKDKLGDYYGKAEDCLSKIRKFAAASYPQSYVRKDAPAVKLELGFIKYDLVPAISYYAPNMYMIPRLTPFIRWEQTIPKDLDPVITQLNTRYVGNLVRNVIRICKYWNKSGNHTTMSSYQLESFVLNVFNGYLPKELHRTYDCFLHMLESLQAASHIRSGDGTVNAISWIRHYRRAFDYDRQLVWLNRLLPGIEGT